MWMRMRYFLAVLGRGGDVGSAALGVGLTIRAQRWRVVAPG